MAISAVSFTISLGGVGIVIGNVMFGKWARDFVRFIKHKEHGKRIRYNPP